MNARAPSIAAPAPVGRSVLVTVLGWLAIASGVWTVLATFWQLELLGAVEEAPMPNIDPAAQDGLFRFVSGFTMLNFAFAAFLIYAGYALWKRRNWARKTFIVLFAIGVGMNLLAIAVAALFGSVAAPMLGDAVAVLSLGGTLVVVVIFPLAFAALFYWLIRRLRSPEIKSEFV